MPPPRAPIPPAVPPPSEEPFTAEDEARAESIVAKAMQRYLKVMPPKLIEDLRARLVDELLGTVEGRRKLRLATSGMVSNGDPSAELERFPSPKVADEKKRSGS